MFVLCRGRCFQCLLSSVVFSVYLFLTIPVYATEIFPRVFYPAEAQAALLFQPFQSNGIHVRASGKRPVSLSMVVSAHACQPTMKCSCDDSCPDCKSGFSHQPMALFPLPINELPDWSTPKIELMVFMVSEYQDSLAPPPPKTFL